MATEAQRRASAKFDAENTVRITLKLNRNTDADILEWLEHRTSKAGAIKQAIRENIR